MLLKYIVIGDTCYEYNPKVHNKAKEIKVKGNKEFVQDDIEEIDSNYFISLIKKRPTNIKYDFNVIRSNANENLNIRLDTDDGCTAVLLLYLLHDENCDLPLP